MSKKTDEFRSQLEQLRDEIEVLANAEELTAEQDERLTEAVPEAARVETDLATSETRDAEVARIRDLALDPQNTEPGDGTIQVGPTVIVTRDNPWDTSDIRANAFTSERQANRAVSDRARQAIETVHADHFSDEHRENAELLAANPVIARHILETGSPAYHEAFEDYVRSGDNYRAAMSLTGSAGGFLVPFTLDPTIILTNNGATNPFRGISTIKTITTDDWNGVSSAGVTAEWLAEGTESADASPTFAQPSITPQKAAAWLFGSFEVLSDSSVAGDVSMLIADAKDRLEATAFATGSGSGQPFGIVTELGLVTASRVSGTSGTPASTATLAQADAYALDNDLPPRHRPNASFVANKAVWNTMRQALSAGSANNNTFWVDFGGAQPSKLIGYPVYESSAMDSTIVSGSTDDVIVLGDFKKYFIVDRVGLSIMYEPLVKGSNQRPTGQAGWFAFWRVGARTVDANAFRMLRL